jgi:hypothetical protein
MEDDNMKIQYIFKHKTDGDIQREVFTLDEIEKGKSLDYVDGMKQDGYVLINRVFVEYITE